MSEYIGPTDVEDVMNDIITFFETSKSPEKEKLRILEIIAEYYEERNMTTVDQILGRLARAAIQKSAQMELFDEKN
jgi:hypothetical protein